MMISIRDNNDYTLIIRQYVNLIDLTAPSLDSDDSDPELDVLPSAAISLQTMQ